MDPLMKQNEILNAQVKNLQTQQNAILEAKKHITLDSEHWTAKRDQLNQQCTTLRKDIHNYKTLRNQFNDQIKQLKTLRTKYKEQLHAIHQQYQTQKQILTTQQQKVTSSPSEVQQEIQRLEWSIQTLPYSAPQERAIINRLSVLEHEARFHHAIACQVESQKQRKHNMTQLTAQIKEIYAKIQQLAKNSQINHNLMLIKVNQLKQTQEAADHAHHKVLTQRMNLQKHQAQYTALDHKIHILIQQIHQNRNKDISTSLHTQLTTKGSEAKKKIKAQKRISFNEFKVLKEKGYI
jgi:uncharacterized coiled-coil DUF342 family protein